MGDEPHDEAVHVAVPFKQRPVEPTGLVVVAVGVVVAALRAPHLVAHQEHRRAHRQQGQRQEVLHLTVAELVDARIFGRPFDAAIPAQIIIGAVAVPFAVTLVVLDVVRDQVVERKPVVTGHEIDAPFGPPLFAPRRRRGWRRDGAGVW